MNVARPNTTATITINPTAATKRLLARSHTLRVSVVVTFTAAAGGQSVSHTVVVTVHAPAKRT